MIYHHDLFARKYLKHHILVIKLLFFILTLIFHEIFSHTKFTDINFNEYAIEVIDENNQHGCSLLSIQ